MVGWGLSVREIEHLGDDLNNKLRSETMKGGRSEKVVINTIMEMKYKDEDNFALKKGNFTMTIIGNQLFKKI